MNVNMASRYTDRSDGLGLIEIMIALALGVIIMLGVTEIATQNSLTRYELERTGGRRAIITMCIGGGQGIAGFGIGNANRDTGNE